MKILSHLLFQVFLVLGLIIGGVFVFQNTDVVTLKIGKLAFEETPIWVILFSAFFIGIFVGYVMKLNTLPLRKK